MYNTAVLYLDGDGVEFNEEAGLEWMHRAADAGVPAAKRYLGEE